jgi:hypothetical protein
VRYESIIMDGPARSDAPPALRGLVDRERLAVSTHRDAVRVTRFPPPKASPPATFLHGLLLPFSLILATLRHPTLRGPYLRLVLVRALFVALFASAAIRSSDGPDIERRAGPVIRWTPRTDASDENAGVHVHAPGVDVDLDEAHGQKKVVVLGKDVPVDDDDDDREKHAGPTKSAGSGETPGHRVAEAISSGWAWIVWFIGIVSTTEAVVVFFSRRWDDWLGFHASAIARIRPEDPQPKTPKIEFDVRWLFRKLKRRIRGYVVFAAGVPLVYVFKLAPMIGGVLFGVGLTVWGWYWLAVFTAAKSAHAWADDGVAPSPLLIREIRDRSAGQWWLAPFRLYGRLWGWLTRDVDSAAATFERSPSAYLGLALARIILAFPGVYLLARPIVPVAAGRLCAESDPADRFSA